VDPGLSASRVLLVIDDVWEQAHARPFLTGGSACRTLITTRKTTVAYDLSTTSRAHRLDVLSPSAALELLGRLAPDVVRVHGTAATLLCKRMEFLPLGLTLAGRLLAVESDVPDRVEHLLEELNERRQARLAMLQDEGRLGIDESAVSLQAILGLSVERLDVVDRERFAILSVLGGDPLTWDLDQAAAVWACAREDAAATVSHLIQHGIVERRGQDYWMHALLADYAAGLLDEYTG
jgi:NB-ARC domain